MNYAYIAKLCLVFTSQLNLKIESGVENRMESSCHDQIVYAKLNYKICYPLPYSREIWHFKEAETGLIRVALNSFN